MFVEVSVDYNQTPCRTVLQEFKMTDIGKIEVSLTGFGKPLNYILEWLTGWIMNHWKEVIALKIENKLKNIISKKLDELKCERFRP